MLRFLPLFALLVSGVNADASATATAATPALMSAENKVSMSCMSKTKSDCESDPQCGFVDSVAFEMPDMGQIKSNLMDALPGLDTSAIGNMFETATKMPTIPPELAKLASQPTSPEGNGGTRRLFLSELASVPEAGGAMGGLVGGGGGGGAVDMAAMIKASLDAAMKSLPADFPEDCKNIVKKSVEDGMSAMGQLAGALGSAAGGGGTSITSAPVTSAPSTGASPPADIPAHCKTAMESLAPSLGGGSASKPSAGGAPPVKPSSGGGSTSSHGHDSGCAGPVCTKAEIDAKIQQLPKECQEPVKNFIEQKAKNPSGAMPDMPTLSTKCQSAVKTLGGDMSTLEDAAAVTAAGMTGKPPSGGGGGGGGGGKKPNMPGPDLSGWDTFTATMGDQVKGMVGSGTSKSGGGSHSHSGPTKTPTICMDKKQANEMEKQMSQMDAMMTCMGYVGKTQCRADDKCVWESLGKACFDKSMRKMFEEQADAVLGIGIGDDIMACMALASDKTGCNANNKCKYNDQMSICMDTASAKAAEKAQTCSAFEDKKTCNKDTNCGWMSVGPGMKFCVDKQTADMAPDMDEMMAEMPAGMMGGMMGGMMPTMAGGAMASPEGSDSIPGTGGDAMMPIDTYFAGEVPMFGCVAAGKKKYCDADFACTWDSKQKMCYDKEAMIMATCVAIKTETDCAADKNCGWADIGAGYGFSKKSCIDKIAADFEKEREAAFSQSSKGLKDLGGTRFKAANTLLKNITSAGAGAGMLAVFDTLEPKDMWAIMGDVGTQMEAGMKLPKEAEAKMLNMTIAPKSQGGMGDMKGWEKDTWKKVPKSVLGAAGADMIEGMAAGMDGEAFEVAMEQFGGIYDLDPTVEDKLGEMYIAQSLAGDMANLTPEKVTKAKGFLPGLMKDVKNIKKIPKDVFKNTTKAFAEVGQKIGAFGDDQKDAFDELMSEIYDEFTDEVIDDLGALAGALGEEKLRKLPDAAKSKLSGSALKTMGGKKLASAFSAEDIAKLDEKAKALVTGADLAAVAASSKEKVKAMVCKDPNNCNIGALTDVTIPHDGTMTDKEYLAKANKTYTDAGVAPMSLKIQQAATPMASTSTGARRLRRLRRLSATTTKATTQTVIRAETATTADANKASTAATAASLGQTSVVTVMATDADGGNSKKNMQLGAAPRHAATSTATTILVVVAVVMAGFC